MRDLPDFKVFPSPLIYDMHKSFDAVFFGKENAGFCFTAATHDPDVAHEKSSAPQ
jgi:hypothetical protein